MYADSHIHISQIPDWQPVCDDCGKDVVADISPVCACSHSPEEWATLAEYAKGWGGGIVRSFGIHPQNPDVAFIEVLEGILKDGGKTCAFPDALGEAGFDLFTAEYSLRVSEQEAVWNAQLEFAEKYSLPLVVHCRHALDRIFADSKKLALLSSVVFHSFPGSPLEAQSILRRHINARFSLGKPLLNGNKRALLCAVELPLELVLAETDAPYQTLKNESVTSGEDIKKVYAKIAELRDIPLNELCVALHKNFRASFLLP